MNNSGIGIMTEILNNREGALVRIFLKSKPTYTFVWAVSEMIPRKVLIFFRKNTFTEGGTKGGCTCVFVPSLQNNPAHNMRESCIIHTWFTVLCKHMNHHPFTTCNILVEYSPLLYPCQKKLSLKHPCSVLYASMYRFYTSVRQIASNTSHKKGLFVSLHVCLFSLKAHNNIYLLS